MATLAALGGASCHLTLCSWGGTTSAGGVEARSRIAVSKGAAGGATALRYTKCPNQVRKLQTQRLRATSAIVFSSGRQLLTYRAPGTLSEKGGVAVVNSLVEEDSAVEPEESVQGQANATPTVKVTFKLQKEIHFGQVFNVAGSSAELGQWDLRRVIPLVWSEDHVWTADVGIPVGQTVEYKFVLTGNRGEVDWQPGENRIFETKDAKELVVSGPWDESIPDISEEVPTAVAQGAFGNSVAPGADVVESTVALAGMVAAKVEETANHLLPKVSENSDIENGKPGGGEEQQASELPAVDAVVATAVTSVTEKDDDLAADDV